MSNQLLTNREVSNLMGNALASFRIRHLRTGRTWRSSYAGRREDHYDSTPMTPEDAEQYLLAFGNNVYDWIAEDVEIEVVPGIWVAAGLVPFRHGGIIGNARPGSSFNNHSNNPPVGGWKRDGGHYCIYFVNSTGGTTSATTLPQSRNRKVSELANQRALNPIARGAMSRAAAQEAFIKNGGTAPPATMPNVTVNYQIEVTGSLVNIRSEPTTSSNIIDSVRHGLMFDIDREQTGLDSQVNNPHAVWLRIRGGKFDGRWIIQRFTRKTNNPPATPMPPKGTWSVQVVAVRSSVEGSLYVDDKIARLRGMGYPDAYRLTSDGWCRARVPAGTEKQARELFPILRDKGFRDAFPVQYN